MELNMGQRQLCLYMLPTYCISSHNNSVKKRQQKRVNDLLTACMYTACRYVWYMQSCIYKHIHGCKCIYVCMHTHTCIDAQVYLYTYVCVCVCVCVCILTNSCKYIFSIKLEAGIGFAQSAPEVHPISYYVVLIEQSRMGNLQELANIKNFKDAMKEK